MVFILASFFEGHLGKGGLPSSCRSLGPVMTSFHVFAPGHLSQGVCWGWRRSLSRAPTLLPGPCRCTSSRKTAEEVALAIREGIAFAARAATTRFVFAAGDFNATPEGSFRLKLSELEVPRIPEPSFGVEKKIIEALSDAVEVVPDFHTPHKWG